jgi:hypothetical protein
MDQKIISLYNEGYPANYIANYLHIDYFNVRKILHDNKVPIRQGGASKNKVPLFNTSRKGKYDHLFFEEVNAGKDYKEYIQ